MKAIVEGVRIAGIHAVVPRQSHSFLDDPAPFTAEEAQKVVASTGVRSRRVLPKPWCASDMCLAAAEALLERLGWAPGSVDVLIFVSQDADYVLPATACLMQRRLGLPTGAAAFDVPLGCSGFVYGVWMAGRLLGGSSAKRALLLCADNATRHLNPEDRATLPLFGDAGTATALELADDAPPMHVLLGSDGSGGRHIFVKAGGKRDCLIPAGPPGTPRPSEEEARLFADARLKLNGGEVFTFTLRVVPPLIKEALAEAGIDKEAVDWFVPHQANKFMLEHLRKRIGIPPERYIIDLEEFGNTSSASIPLAIANRIGGVLADRRQTVLMAGFGVGWSWGTIITDMGPMCPPSVTTFPDDYPVLEA